MRETYHGTDVNICIRQHSWHQVHMAWFYGYSGGVIPGCQPTSVDHVLVGVFGLEKGMVDHFSELCIRDRLTIKTVHLFLIPT